MCTTLFDKIKDEGPVSGSGGPLVLFPESFEPTISIHDAVAKGMGKNWVSYRDILQPTIENHLEHTETVKEMMSLYNISKNECGSIVYYSCDARRFGGKREDSPFFQLNYAMSKRNFIELENWKEFLFYLLSGLQKIPNVNERVFRALDKPISHLSKQYKVGNTVVWISFTSTSQDLSIAKKFMDDPNTKGTIMSIDVIEGKDISPFSLFQEKEVLLLPNSSFEVKEITSSDMKNLVNIPSSMDGIILIQKQTPPHLLLMKAPVHEADFELRKKWEEYMQKKEELNKQWEDNLKREQEKYKIHENVLKREQVERQNLEKKYKILENDLKREQENAKNVENNFKQEKVERKNLEKKYKILENDLKREQENAKNVENNFKQEKVERKNLEKKYKILENDLKREQENSNKLQNNLEQVQVERQNLEKKYKILENDLKRLTSQPLQEIEYGKGFNCKKCNTSYEWYEFFLWKRGDTVDCSKECGNQFHFN